MVLKRGLVGLGLVAIGWGQPLLLMQAVAQEVQERQVAASLTWQIEGELNSESESVEGRFVAIHQFEGQAGEQITINLESEDLDPYLIIVGPDQAKVAEDNDSGNGTHAQVLLKLTQTGTYSLLVTSASPEETGSYVLSQRPTTETDWQLAKAVKLNQRVLQLNQAGKYQEATPLAEEALKIRRQILDDDHPDVVTSINNLAVLYESQGRYREAEPLYQQALELSKRILGDDHPDIALSINNLAALYESQGRYSEAESLYQQALDLKKRILGDEHPGVALSINNLAFLYSRQGRYSEAESLYQQALDLKKRILGDDHPDIALSINNLAFLYSRQGRYGEAEPLYQHALELSKRILGDEHPRVATTINNLAGLYSLQGRYGEADLLYQHALELSKRILGDDHPQVATSLNNLAVLYSSQDRYSEAEPLYEEALELRKRILGDDHPDVATSINNLAGLYSHQDRYSEAELLYQQALELHKRILGDDHPDVATSINNLAGLYSHQGRYSEAELLYQQALELSKRTLGDEHPQVANSFNNLAGLYSRQGRYSEAAFFFQQGLVIEEIHLETNLLIGTETQKRDYIRQLQGTTYGTISLDLNPASQDSQATTLAFSTLVRRKGRILETINNNFQQLQANLTPADQKKLDQYLAAQTQLATLTYQGSGQSTLEQYRQNLKQLRIQVKELQAQLNNRSAEFHQQNQPVTLEAVKQKLPADTILLEIAQYRPRNLESTSDANSWSDPHYAAYILSSTDQPISIDLGPAAPIDQATANFRRALATKDPNIKTIARQLDAQLMQPIRAKLGELPTGEAKQLLISPDSQLNLIPFAALVDENNQYLVENYDISYLTSGRDLLRLNNPELQYQPRQGPLLVANPDYANPGTPTIAQDLRKSDPSPRKGGFSQQSIAQRTNPHAKSAPTQAQTSPRLNLGEGSGERAAQATIAQANASISEPGQPNRRSSDLNRSFNFAPLPGTAEEARIIGQRLPNATVLTGTHATENAIKAVNAPSILHIATHGFFLNDLPQPDPNNSRGFGGFRAGIQVLGGNGNAPLAPSFSAQTENPLLRSGLALAGFNKRSSGDEDGVLTALEAANLNLRGTQLVVLSACETGLGDVANGEGVYGLRRAFVMAGAETQLISLWKVDDFGTKDLMVSYYDKLIDGEGRADALHQTQRDMLQGQYSHPYYWASFISSGDWRPLDE